MPTQCQGIRDAIAGIKQDIRDFQQMLPRATASEKKEITAALKALKADVKQKEQALRECLLNWWRTRTAPPAP